MVLQENMIEQRLRKETKARGGLAFKFVSPGMSGVPDRLVLMPGGRMACVELKAPGKHLREQQKKRKEQLEKLGFVVYAADSLEMIGGILDEIQGT